MEWLLIMFVIYGKLIADPRWPKVVCSIVRQNFLLTDSKLQGLVNVNIKIRKCHPKMFCTYAGTKKISFRGELLGITSNKKNPRVVPRVTVLVFSIFH